MKDFKEEDLEIIIRPTIKAMEDKIREIVYYEVDTLGLNNYLKPGIYVSRDDELSSGKIDGWIYLLNIGSVTIRIKFKHDPFSGDFIYTKLLIDTSVHQLEIRQRERNIFKLCEIGFFKPIVKIWLDVLSGDFEDLLSELNDINGTGVWTLKHIVNSGYPKIYLPLYYDGHLIARPEEDTKDD